MRTSVPSMIRALMLLLALPGLALAADPEGGGGEVGFLAGASYHEDELTGGSSDELAWTAGFRGGSYFTPRWGWFVDGIFSAISSDVDADSITARATLELLSRRQSHRRWYLGFGAGVLDWDPDSGAQDEKAAMASVGFGQRVKLRGRKTFRWEIRGDHTLRDGDFGADVTQLHFLGGLMWGQRPVATRDADGDGVPDGRDRCPGTKRGAGVDRSGCTTDGDRDGVPDGLDVCPNTLRGWSVDARGCPRDSDRDGVPDGADACADTRSRVIVDARGCPLDGDGDGVPDGLDRCPETARGAEVGRSGCATAAAADRDRDGDGVPDGRDRCSGTPVGARVDGRGCPLDEDADGVADGLDRCPGTPAGREVRADGCERARPLFDDERRSLVLEGVFFDLDGERLTATSRDVLERVAESLRDWPEVRVEISGHTDSRGSDEYNLSLSTRRADTVRRYLAGRGVAERRMVVRGFGEARPIADNGTASGRARNRRVELTRLD